MLYSGGPVDERMLCCNVLTADEYSRPEVFRHPFYSYDESVQWPPPRWQEGHCNYCAHAFDRPNPDALGAARVPCPPVPIPCFHEKRTNEWRITGIFCSWNCAKAELLAAQGLASGSSALLLDHFARAVFGYKGPDIVPAPPRTWLSFFYPGADTLDIDAFRASSAHSFTSVLLPPLLSTPEIYERHALRATASSWSVRGIRAKSPPEPSTKPVPITKTLSDFGELRTPGCQYQSFISRKSAPPHPEDAGPSPAGPADTGDRNCPL